MGSSPHMTETGLGLGDGFGLQRGKEPPTAVTSVTIRCLESRCELGALFWPFNSARPSTGAIEYPHFVLTLISREKNNLFASLQQMRCFVDALYREKPSTAKDTILSALLVVFSASIIKVL